MFKRFRQSRSNDSASNPPAMLMRKSPPRAACWAAITFTLIAASVNVRAQTVSASPPGNTEVPVKEVVLFSSGVGYFQHEGTVHDDASTELRFKTAQINDILKSLVLNDLGGGRVGVVTYPSQDPLAKTLASFQVDISDNPSEGQLLDKLRGARITLGYGAETLTGTVLGVEEREVPGGKEGADPLKLEFLNLVTEAGIRSLSLPTVDHFQLEDRNLQEELSRALAAVAGARDKDKKPVDIRFNGQGDRRVRVGYVVETPIWKASYRLVLPDKEAGDKQGFLQGWAIVDNQTDNDWKNVRLSLVSGRPISFIQDLYQPLYVPRPTVVPELYASLRPQEYEGGQVNKTASADRLVVTGSNVPTSEEVGAAPVDTVDQATRDNNDKENLESPLSRKTLAIASRGGSLSQSPAKPMNVSESVAPLSDAAKVGELFQYTVPDVSLARQQSAMIPIINDPVEVEKVSIYNRGVLASHPLNGARLKNTTEDKKHLLQGPLTVFDGGRYAGDARLDDVPPGQTRLLSYGVDLQMDTTAKELEGKQLVQTAKIVGGVFHLICKYTSAIEFDTENKSEEDKTLVIEYPVSVAPGSKLVDTPAPVETTDKLYRFQQEIAAGKKDVFTVHEENVVEDTTALTNVGSDQIEAYSKTGEIPAAVRDALAKLITRRQVLQATQDQIDQVKAQIKSISDDQGRVRENLKSVDGTSAYAIRLLKKLDDQESQLEKLRADAGALETKLAGQNKEYTDALANLNVD